MNLSTSFYTFLALALIASIVGAIVTYAVDTPRRPSRRPIVQP